MIFYFSGTGNSLWVAKYLAAAFNENSTSISEELRKTSEEIVYHVQENEKIFFVFPVHSWGPAVLLERFVKRLILKGYDNQQIYVICTCGDESGYTDKIFRKMLEKRAYKLTNAYSLIMPNNYILMKGFDTDPESVEKEKLKNAPLVLNKIIKNIQGENNGSIYTKGKLAFLKSYLIYSLFKQFAIGKNSFHVEDKCISCGQCATICPSKCIELINKRPVWNNFCVQCTACIHLCPANAIEYGNVSSKKGRYHHPDLKINISENKINR